VVGVKCVEWIDDLSYMLFLEVGLALLTRSVLLNGISKDRAEYHIIEAVGPTNDHTDAPVSPHLMR